jgi:hypothetical protein
MWPMQMREQADDPESAIRRKRRDRIQCRVGRVGTSAKVREKVRAMAWSFAFKEADVATFLPLQRQIQ